jgi:DNA polymerase-3 subunit delta
MAKSSSTTVTALQVLMSPGQHRLGPVCAVVGDNAFLRHEVRLCLTRLLDTGDEQGFAVGTRDGRTAQWRDILDSLSERSLFGNDNRTVVVEDADALVKNYRNKIEQYVEKPATDALLLLEVTTLPGNTRLAKAIAKSGLTIRCQVPQKGAELTQFTKQLKDWLVQVAREECDVELKRPAVDLLLQLLPTEVGVLYQEVAKLSLLAGDKKKIDADLVRDHVGSWRTRKTWDMIDAVAEGRAADALGQLDRLLAAGEEPHALLPQMASTLRRFAAAARLFEQGERRGQPMSLRSALQQSGMLPFKLSDAEGQLRQIGRPRAKQLYRWLLAADLALKGHNSTKDRARREIETLIVRLART